MKESKWVWESVWERVIREWVNERERECMRERNKRVREWESERECVCVREREIEGKREWGWRGGEIWKNK